MDIKTERQYMYMIVAEYSCWDDGISFMSINDDRVKNKRFIVSLQSNATDRISYDSRGFDKMTDVINAIDGRTNVCQVIKNPNRYLYFDIDKIEINVADFTAYITAFIDALNCELLENDMTVDALDMKDFECHIKEKNNKIISIHLITTRYYMNFRQMRNLAKLLNQNENICVDEAIYDKSRRFFNCFSGKIGKPVFQYMPLGCGKDWTDYEMIWIDDISSHETTKIDFTREPVNETISIEEDIVTYIIRHKEKYLKRSYNWFVFMLYVKDSCEMTREDFCRQSLTDGWNYEENIIQWDIADTTFALKNVDDVSKTLFNKRFIRNPINVKFCAHIQAPDELRNELMKIPSHHVNIILDGLTFEKKGGLLTHKNKTSLYYADLYRVPIYSKTIPVSQNDVYDVIKNQSRVFVNALYGGGKTHFVIAPVIMDAINNDMSVLVITENNSLNKQYEDDKRLNLISHLKNCDADYQVSSLESLWKLKRKDYDVIILDELLSLMTHFHSAKTMRQKEIQIYNKLLYYIDRCKKCVVCDADLTADTYAGFLDKIQTNREIYKIIVPKYDDYSYNIVFERGKIVSKMIDDLKNGLRPICACDIKQTAKQVQETILKTFEYKKNVLSVMGNETGYGYLFNGEELTNEQHNFLFKNHLQDADYDETKKYDLNEFIHLFNVDAMIYSPKIKTGVSINGKCFDKQYGIGSGRSVTSREFIQMIHRARDLTDTNIWVSLPKPRTDEDLSKINAKYVEKMYDDGTNVLNEILSGDKIDCDTRDGLTEILAEGCAEIRRSRKCFTTEFYNSILNMGLKCVVHINSMEEKGLEVIESEVSKWIGLGLPTKKEINVIVKKMMEDNDCLTANEKLTMKYLRIFLKYETIYSPKENQMKRYNFYGLFSYERLEAFLERTEEKEVYSFIDINRIRHNREKYLYETNLSHIDLMEIHNSYVDKSTRQSALDDATKNTALYFFRHLTKLKDEKSFIKKSLIKFSNKDLEIINAIYKHERKNKTELKSFNTTSKIEDIMRFVSKIIMKHYGSKFIVSNGNRNSYIERPHPRLIIKDYHPTFEDRLKAKQIDIEKIGHRGALKTEDTYDGFFKIRNITKKNVSGRYSTKADLYDNKVISRKMKQSLYATAKPYWNLKEYQDPKHPKNKIYVYETDDKPHKHFHTGIYEPALLTVYEMSKFITDKTDDYLKIYEDPYKKPKIETEINPVKLYHDVAEVFENTNYDEDKSHNEKLNRNDFFKEVTRPNSNSTRRERILLRQLKYKIRIREQQLTPEYDTDDNFIEIERGYGFVFENVSIPLIFYHLKITHGYKYKAKYEIDFDRPYKMTHIIDGCNIHKIYITHLDISVSHNLINLKNETTYILK